MPPTLRLEPSRALLWAHNRTCVRFGLGVVTNARSRYRADIVIPRDLADEKLVPLPIRLPEDLYEWLREAAHRRRMPMAELVREALREYRESQDPQIDLWTPRDAGR